jgi:hypothetical protein
MRAFPLKGLRVIGAYDEVFRGCFRKRRISASGGCPVVIPIIERISLTSRK